jgi:hypothetical protein
MGKQHLHINDEENKKGLQQYSIGLSKMIDAFQNMSVCPNFIPNSCRVRIDFKSAMMLALWKNGFGFCLFHNNQVVFKNFNPWD